MEYTEHIVEYYDELYPVCSAQLDFFDDLLKDSPYPAKFLRIGCGTGVFELMLSRRGIDVTAIAAQREFIDTAVRKRRPVNTALRFFQMTHLEIGRFLAKGFYTCAAVLDGFLYFIHDTVLLRKFFYDCKNLLSTRGSLVLHLPDICEVKESPRVKLISSLDTETTPALLT